MEKTGIDNNKYVYEYVTKGVKVKIEKMSKFNKLILFQSYKRYFFGLL